MIPQEKQLLRARMKATLRAFTQQGIASQAIRDRLLASAAWQSARVIYGFQPLPSEPDWQGGRWPEDKILAFPRTLDAGGLAFFCSREFRIGPWKAHEPIGDEAAPPPDLILVPGLAFDRQGHRMGRGGGFYDRWLALHPHTPRLGLCFDCQLLDHIPHEPHDALMQAILTEASELRF